MAQETSTRLLGRFSCSPTPNPRPRVSLSLFACSHSFARFIIVIYRCRHYPVVVKFNLVS
jgi:hypothetical protein